MQLAFFSAKESKLIASMTVHPHLEQPLSVKKVKNVNTAAKSLKFFDFYNRCFFKIKRFKL